MIDAFVAAGVTQREGKWVNHRAEKAEAAWQEAKKEVATLQELREGDFELTRALAEDAGIKILANDKLPGRQWEQFHDGVMGLAGLAKYGGELVNAAENAHLNPSKERLDELDQAIAAYLAARSHFDKDEERWNNADGVSTE